MTLAAGEISMTRAERADRDVSQHRQRLVGGQVREQPAPPHRAVDDQ
jgi:hypothetical protein